MQHLLNVTYDTTFYSCGRFWQLSSSVIDRYDTISSKKERGKKQGQEMLQAAANGGNEQVTC